MSRIKKIAFASLTGVMVIGLISFNSIDDRTFEIAKNLDSLFSFMLSRLPEVDMRNDPEPARE